jgi:predicted transcriptional regulator
MEIRDKILKILNEKNYGLSIEEVSKILQINRSTASKYLFALESGNKITVRLMGKAKLHYPRSVKI